ncbi:MAG TPA: PIN domain-containing protein [Phycisphaerae bacterium]|nr:PIN domain-containing protein [Phycisphaerae bacterium]
MSNAVVYQLDANVLLRFLRNDHKEHSLRARKLIEQANAGAITLEVSAVTVAEIFYALKAFYRVDRRAAARTLAMVLNTPGFRLPELHRILDAMARVQSANIDFGDAYLASTASESNTPIASFDSDLDVFADVKRHKP